MCWKWYEFLILVIVGVVVLWLWSRRETSETSKDPKQQKPKQPEVRKSMVDVRRALFEQMGMY